MKKTCDHSVCVRECHFALPPTSIEHSERRRPLGDIEQSGVRVGQRYEAFQKHLGPCRIVALGLSTHLGHLTAMVAFETAPGVTYFKELREFIDTIAGHKRWTLIPNEERPVNPGNLSALETAVWAAEHVRYLAARCDATKRWPPDDDDIDDAIDSANETIADLRRARDRQKERERNE